LIIGRLLKTIDISKAFYVDIGAYDPIRMSNTYSFYLNGGHGILVEPDHALCAKSRRKRPRDTVIEAGIGLERGTRTFYEFKEKTLSTFSEEDAEVAKKRGCPMIGTREVKVMTFADVIAENKVTNIDVLSIDVEGLDLEILKSIDYEKIHPKIICTETKRYDQDIPGDKTEAASFLKGKGYMLIYSLVNSIFVDPRTWKK
jgi:FkbM family methyltransferase